MTILRDPGGERLFIEGRLEGVSVPDLIHATCLPGKTGLLTLSHGEVSKTVYIQKGQLIFASSNQPDERLGETLLRSGAIGYAQLEEAVALLGGGKRLGAILVELGHLTPANLVRGLLHQVKEIILGLFPWGAGAYRFAEGPLPTAEVITLNIATSKLICDGLRRINSWPRIARAVGSSRTTYRLTRDGRLLAAELDLGEAEREILSALEEPTTVGRICRSVFLPNFDVYQYLWAFRILGIARQVETEPAQTAGWTPPDEQGGTLVETPLAELLLRLSREEETGVLHLSRGDEEKTIHVKEGMVSFATSNRAEESLTTFLLRRGVIALHDKEELETRMLTNKRVGTLLHELGILSHEELARFVREQVLEIVLGAFAWESGEWRFIPGELPTMEEITLDRSTGELVLQGIRSIRDWSRIRAGCGDLDTILAPTAAHQAALAGVETGTDEKELLAAAATPRTVGEICAATQVPDFRAAQILWAMRVLGVLERLEAMPKPAAPPAQEAPEVALAGAAGEQVAEGPAAQAREALEEASADLAALLAPRPAEAGAPDLREAGGPPAATPVPGEAPDAAAPAEPAKGAADVDRALPGSAGEPAERAASRPGPAGARAVEIPVQVEAAARDAAPFQVPILATDEGSVPVTMEVGEEAGRVIQVPVSGPPGPPQAVADEPDAPAAEGIAIPVVAAPAAGVPDHAPAEAPAAGLPDLAPAEGALTGRSGRAAAVAPPAPEGDRPDGSAEDTFPAAAPAGARTIRIETPAPAPARRTPIEAVGTGVLEEIERFNRRHREVYAVLKGSVGSGARNLVANCAKRLGEGAQVFAGLAMDETGAFPAELLFERVGDRAPAQIRAALEALIGSELRISEGMLDAATVKRLEKRLEAAGSGLVEPRRR